MCVIMNTVYMNIYFVVSERRCKSRTACIFSFQCSFQLDVLPLLWQESPGTHTHSTNTHHTCVHTRKHTHTLCTTPTMAKEPRYTHTLHTHARTHAHAHAHAHTHRHTHNRCNTPLLWQESLLTHPHTHTHTQAHTHTNIGFGWVYSLR